MKRILLLILLPITFAKAQNYSLFPKEGASYFSDGKEVYILKIDSVKKAGTNTYYFPLRQPLVLQNRGNSCPDPTVTWITDSTQTVVDTLGGVKVQGLFLKKSARLGEEWVAQTNGASKIIGTVSKWELKTILGITDSVKTFRFRTEGSAPSIFNDLFYEISKQHGLVGTRMHGLSQYQGVLRPLSEEGSSISLIGLEKEDLGFQVHTNKEIFAYEVGDEFHLIDEEYRGLGEYVSRDSIKEVVIKKKVDSLAIHYTFSRKVKHIQYAYDPRFGSSSYYLQDTTLETYLLDEPHQKQINKLLKYHESETMMQYYDLQQGKDSVVYRYIQSAVQCVWEGMSYPETIKYVLGLVGTYYTQGGTSPMAHSSRELVYYKKGSKEWGKPLVLSLVSSDISSHLVTTVSPNPSKGKINVQFQETSDQSTFELFDGDGRKVFESSIGSQAELDVSLVYNGLYFYKVTTASGKYGSGKLLISK